MAISHADHNHPNTPAARAACRKRMAAGQSPRDESAERALAGIVKPAQLTVVPRTRGDGGVVKGLKATAPKTSTKALKRTNTHIRADHDLADVPRMLAYGVRLAWAADWDVLVGDRFNVEEARIVIKGDLADISLVWKDSNPEGLNAIWIRHQDSSKQFKVESVQHAIELAQTHEVWDEFGNLIG